MDAKELTKKYYKLDGEVADITKRIEYLEEEYRKIRLLVDDMSVDVKMLQSRRQ